MGQYDFFNGCYKAALKVYQNLINTPRTRTTGYIEEIRGIKEQIETAYSYGEITLEEYNELIKKFTELDFSKIPEIRANKAKSQKMGNQASKFLNA